MPEVMTVEVSHIAKAFGAARAVTDVSFEVGQGEIFGLLGPNGAGKTTTIRMLLDIFKPDQGFVSVLGGPMTEAKKARIGYMPEERGLYQNVPLETCLLYLASLKDVPSGEARSRLNALLERFDLAEHRKKKVKALSKGMQQKAQLITAILHRPALLIIDEPFASLDPVNTYLVKEVMHELRAEGTTILMSTHQMHQVEELCDRLVLIDHGANVLYGHLADIRRRFTGNAVLVQVQGVLPALTGVAKTTAHNGAVRLTLDETTHSQTVLRQLMAHDCVVERFEIAVPTLDEIFVRVVQGQTGERITGA